MGFNVDIYKGLNEKGFNSTPRDKYKYSWIPVWECIRCFITSKQSRNIQWFVIIVIRVSNQPAIPPTSKNVDKSAAFSASIPAEITEIKYH